MLACGFVEPPSNWTIVLRTVDAFAPIMAAATVLGLVLLLLLPRLLPSSHGAPLSQRRVVLRDGLAVASSVAIGFALGPVALLGGLACVAGMHLVLGLHRVDPHWERPLM
ncbi:MAG: hypothetical protein IT370_38130 [Deltaproteobacteria bacterium]|nr:hypothetical protein [Deltaproteobacteria bacterium]